VDASTVRSSALALIVKPLAITTGVVAIALLSACTAHTKPEPGKFPDISGYTPVNVDDYRIDTSSPGFSSNQVVFLTPDGIPCTFAFKGAGCTGDNLPGISPKDKNPYTYIDTAVGIQRAGSTPYVDNMIRDQQIKTVPPFHSITVDGVTCGVDDEKTTACKDSQGRGFVLSPTWSGWLPKV
jgi:hypothetical protein